MNEKASEKNDNGTNKQQRANIKPRKMIQMANGKQTQFKFYLQQNYSEMRKSKRDGNKDDNNSNNTNNIHGREEREGAGKN